MCGGDDSLKCPMPDEWPKVLREAVLPAELVGFLADVSTKLERGDYEAVTESDDLLQCDFAYGGRNKEGGDAWGFTYFLKEPDGAKWEVQFSRAALRALAAGTMEPTVKLWFCTRPGCANAFPNDEWRCMHSDGSGYHSVS